VTGLIVLSAVLLAMLVAFLWFYWYSRTPEWGESETRKAALRMLVVIGPIFGMHYTPPKPEIPTISAPGPDQPADLPGVVIPPRQEGDPPGRPDRGVVR
jgi:hypothetical protein